MIYEVRLDTRLMGKTQGEINAVLMALVEAARAEGVEWSDSLPITRTAPFRFTTENPYFVTERDEEGVEVKTLTRLGRLAVKMKWIEDPTQEPQEEERHFEYKSTGEAFTGLGDLLKDLKF